jgi:LacI family gluconate utilization system Gnt-I transcriptional repressor
LSVGFSQHQAAAQHLIERGRRRLGFIAAQLDPRVMQRAEGFRQALAEAGLQAPELEMLDPQPSSIALGSVVQPFAGAGAGCRWDLLL